MQIRPSLGFRIVSIRVVPIKKTNYNKDKDMGKEKYLFWVVWVQSDVTTIEMSVEGSQGTKTRSATWLKYITAGHIPGGLHYSPMFIAALCRVVRNGTGIDVHQLKMGNENGVRGHYGAVKEMQLWDLWVN